MTEQTALFLYIVFSTGDKNQQLRKKNPHLFGEENWKINNWCGNLHTARTNINFNSHFQKIGKRFFQRCKMSVSNILSIFDYKANCIDIQINQ